MLRGGAGYQSSVLEWGEDLLKRLHLQARLGPWRGQALLPTAQGHTWVLQEDATLLLPQVGLGGLWVPWATLRSRSWAGRPAGHSSNHGFGKTMGGGLELGTPSFKVKVPPPEVF